MTSGSKGTQQVIEARYHDRVNVLQALNGGQACAPAPFDRAAWYQLLADSGLRPLVAVASEAGTSAALVLREHGGWITPLRNWYSFTWRPLAPQGAQGDALLAAIARHLHRRAHRVTLEPVPGEDGSATRLAAAFRAAGWLVEVSQCDTNHILRVNGRSFAAYWESRPGRLRSTLKRKSSKVETRILTAYDPAAWAAYERIYAASWKPAEANPAMLRAFAKAEAAAGRLRLGLAFHEGEAIAAQFWTIENGTAYIHKLAHRESHKHLSAGTTLTAALFAHVIDTDHAELIDFGTGDEPYKADWMEETRARYRIDCLAPLAWRAWPLLGKRMLRRIVTQRRATLAPGVPRG
ncbi:MAG: GNAT family N-acetyltransferase [Erythrobacter sp.]